MEGAEQAEYAGLKSESTLGTGVVPVQRSWPSRFFGQFLVLLRKNCALSPLPLPISRCLLEPKPMEGDASEMCLFMVSNHPVLLIFLSTKLKKGVYRCTSVQCL